MDSFRKHTGISGIPTLALSKSGKIHEVHELWRVEGHTFLSDCLTKSAASSPFIQLEKQKQETLYMPPVEKIRI